MKILVTGGSGFIGTRLVGELLEGGHEVRILDKVPSTHYSNICQVGDVRDLKAVDMAVRGVDIVYHLAAEHRDDVRPISLYYEVNVDGTQNLANACAANGVHRFIFASSVAVYGLNAGSPSEDNPTNPFNEYSRSKLQGENVLKQWAGENPGASLTIVRPTVVFGEGNRGNVYNLVKQIASGRFIMVGNGDNRKSMAYIGNISAFFKYIGEAKLTGIKIFNYVDKPDLSMNELVGSVRNFIGKPSKRFPRLPYGLGMLGGFCFDMISTLTGKKFPISCIRVKKFCADTTVSIGALKETDFVPPYSINKGIEFFLNNEFPRD
ncbi:MAG: NAD-dependent epimerase/dehydratase family protein [Proteobacteria bacterium]|nr:NAD-dependent epimerase/dehydratase family protein [Pseudomonadota bacterium]